MASLPPIWMPDLGLLDAQDGPQPGAGEPPAAPVYEPPALLSAQPAGFRERLGMALADLPAFQPGRGASGGQALLGGLLSGAARSFGRSEVMDRKSLEANREQANTTRKAEADRNYANAQETWRQKLTQFYRTRTDESGKVRVTRKMADEMGLPSDVVGTFVEPLSLADKLRAARQATASTITDPEVARVLGMKVGDRTSPDMVLRAGTLLKPSSPGGSGAFGASFDPEAIADAIHEGRQLAIPSNYSRGAWNSIASILEKKYHEDAGKLVLNAASIRQQVATMNQNQMLSYRSAIAKVVPTLDFTESLVNQLEQSVPQGMIKELNKAQLAAITRGAYGEKAANLATQIIGQINGPLNGEMATVYSRGGVPTDEARRGVQRQVNENMGPSNLRAAFSAMRRDLGYADSALQEIGAWSPYGRSILMPGAPGGGMPEPSPASPSPAAPDAVEEWVFDRNGKLVKASGVR